ncbi:MAG: pirin family protein [Pseudomonadales bacterium]
MTTRTLQRRIRAIDTADGAGVRLRRSLGQRPDSRLDPFLMLDEFASDDPNDYAAGFPSHPHRGFETVTYMLEGHLLHEDHLGNRGHLAAGGAQWMTAGRGIIHSEMPQQVEGRMHGFQLWINLPAREKMKPGGYRDVPAGEIPQAPLPGGGRVRVLAGTLDLGDRRLDGPITGISTDPVFMDVTLPAGSRFAAPIPADHHALVYVFEGSIRVGTQDRTDAVDAPQAGLLGPGDSVQVHTGAEPARLLLLAARPLNEPVVQYGPFVMNSREEIEQALADYQAGTLTG